MVFAAIFGKFLVATIKGKKLTNVRWGGSLSAEE